MQSRGRSGEEVLGPYRIERELGRGGMGRVCLARHQGFDRQVALKMLLNQKEPSSEQLARFQREGEALALLNHPNIVRVFEAGHAGQVSYLALEFVEGEPLDQTVKRGPLPAQEAIRITIALCGALGHAHSRDVLHRDLKPANVILDGAGQPRLTDFGLALQLEAEDERLSRTGQTLGTPAYMAPEQAAGEKQRIDARTDVYGLGATLYALLTGLAPFRASSQMQVITSVLRTPPDPPSSHVSGLDPDLDAIVLKCLKKARLERYPSMADLASDLQRFSERDLEAEQARRRRIGRVAGITSLVFVVGAIAFALRPAPAERLPSATPRELRLAKNPALSVGGVEVTSEGELAVRVSVEGEPTSLLLGPAGAEQPISEAGDHLLPLAYGPNQIRLLVRDEGGEHEPVTLPVIYRVKLREGVLEEGERPGEFLARDGSVLVFHPPGTFQMGMTPGDRRLIRLLFETPESAAEEIENRAKREDPLHQVRLTKGFLLGKHEVTWRQFDAYSETAGREKLGRNPIWFREGPDGETIARIDTSSQGGDFSPAFNVTHLAARDYLKTYGLRLPTEAEWEYAARGPGETPRVFPWGDLPSREEWAKRPLANLRDGRYPDPFPFSSPVGSFPAGASWRGVLDLAGNVYEWTSDAKYFYVGGEETDPVWKAQRLRKTTPRDERTFQIKGGAYDTPGPRLRNAFRNSQHESEEPEGDLGFRVALDAW